MNPEDRVLDDIDRLVDEQLQQERSGYDWNINQPMCPRECGDEWHGLATGQCPGSGAEGPLAEGRWSTGSPMPTTSPGISRILERLRGRPPRIYRWGGHVDEGPQREGPYHYSVAADGTVVDEAANAAFQQLAASAVLAGRAMGRMFHEFAWEIPDDPFSAEARDSRGPRRFETAFTVPNTPENRRMLGLDPEEPATPQQRALPRPTHTPPMWAQQPNQRPRRRTP